MVPAILTRDQIAADEARCPLLPRPRRAEPRPRDYRARRALTLAPWADEPLQSKVRALGRTVRQMRLRCCRPPPEREVPVDPDPGAIPPVPARPLVQARLDGSGRLVRDPAPVLLPNG